MLSPGGFHCQIQQGFFFIFDIYHFRHGTKGGQYHAELYRRFQQAFLFIDVFLFIIFRHRSAVLSPAGFHRRLQQRVLFYFIFRHVSSGSFFNLPALGILCTEDAHIMTKEPY